MRPDTGSCSVLAWQRTPGRLPSLRRVGSRLDRGGEIIRWVNDLHVIRNTRIRGAIHYHKHGDSAEDVLNVSGETVQCAEQPRRLGGLPDMYRECLGVPGSR